MREEDRVNVYIQWLDKWYLIISEFYDDTFDHFVNVRLVPVAVIQANRATWDRDMTP
jgi:hypothetical protein